MLREQYPKQAFGRWLDVTDTLSIGAAFVQLHQSHHMPNPHLPPEISDFITDLLHDEPQTLRQCCLVSKSWVPRTRKHLFRQVRLDCSAHVDEWMKTFPDPANSPGYHTRSLSIACVEDITAADVEEGSWFWAFSNVVRLEVSSSGMRYMCSNPLLQLPYTHQIYFRRVHILPVPGVSGDDLFPPNS